MGKKVKCGVYKITCVQNNKIYIGSSNNISSRISGHKYLLRKRKHHNYYLQTDWNLYGEDSFKFEILELTDDDNFSLEQKYLDNLKPFQKLGNGYNINEVAMPTSSFARIHVPKCAGDGVGYVYGNKRRMFITDYEYFNKSREELLEEFEGYTTLEDLNEELVLCNPDWE